MRKKKPTYQELEKKVFELKAQTPNALYFAHKEIDKCNIDRLTGSGLILEITHLGGKNAVSPCLISNGLSNETIEAIKKDLKRSYDYLTEFKL